MTGTEDDLAYRAALGAYATGVAVVTARDGAGVTQAITVNSFTSVSLRPRLILWCLGDESERYETFAAAAYFGVCVLGADQRAMAAHCAQSGAEFDESITEDLAGAPALKGALTRLACRTTTRQSHGDHLVIVGEVMAFDARAGAGLLFYRGEFGSVGAP